MASLQQMRSRIRSVQSTQKITRAMQMVAGAKLRQTQTRFLQSRDFVDRLETIAREFLKAAHGLSHPYLPQPPASEEERDASTPPVAFVIIASDTGLCGIYNERLLSQARPVMAKDNVVAVPVGKKALLEAQRHQWPILESFVDLGGKVTESLVQKLSSTLIDAYLNHKISGVKILYSEFVSAMSWNPKTDSWLPLAVEVGPTEDLDEPYVWEPTPPEIADRLFPQVLTAKLRRILLEAMTSEHSARMIAMKNATDNAAEMIDSLTLLRNKLRQASITTDISEIAAGAEALKQ